MSDYFFFEDWMTDPQLHETDFQAVESARVALQGWSNAKIRRVERYLCRIGNLARGRKWGMIVEERLNGTETRPALYLSKFASSERLAVNILRLAAKRVLETEVIADILQYRADYTKLVEIQSKKSGEQDSQKQQDEKTSKNQRIKAGKPRSIIIGINGERLNEIICEIAKSENYKEEKALQLWSRFYSKLTEMKLNPIATETNADIKKWELKFDKYGFPNEFKTVSFGRFENIVSEYRTVTKKSR